MDVKELYPFTLLIILVAMVIGAGVLALDKFGNASLNAATVVDETFVANNATFVTLGQSTITGSTATYENATVGAAYPTSYFNLDRTDIYAASRVILTSSGAAAGVNNTNVNISYSYGATTAASTALAAGRTEVANVSSNWLGLVVTIAILSIIIVLIVQGFGRTRR